MTLPKEIFKNEDRVKLQRKNEWADGRGNITRSQLLDLISVMRRSSQTNML